MGMISNRRVSGWAVQSLCLLMRSRSWDEFRGADAGEIRPVIEVPFGAYLAGRHAQQMRDYQAAAAWFEDALRDRSPSAGADQPRLSDGGE